MANKIDAINAEIQKLLEKKKELITKRENEIGKYLLSKWNIDFSFDLKDIKKIITDPEVIKLVESKLSITSEIENSPENSNSNVVKNNSTVADSINSNYNANAANSYAEKVAGNIPR